MTKSFKYYTYMNYATHVQFPSDFPREHEQNRKTLTFSRKLMFPPGNLTFLGGMNIFRILWEMFDQDCAERYNQNL